MDYINYGDQNQPSREQQPQCTTTPITHHAHHTHHSHHSHHQSAMNHSFPHHLQLQPVSQHHGAFLQPHHTQPAGSTAPSPHLHHLQQGGQPVPFMPLGAHPLGFVPRQEGEGGVGRSQLQQNVPPTSHQTHTRDPGRAMDNLFSTVIQEDIDLPASHLEPSAPRSMTLRPTESSTPGQLALPSFTSPSSSNPTVPTTTTAIQPSSTSTQSNRPPLTEKAAGIDSEENRQKNASQEVAKQSYSEKPIPHAKLPEGFSYHFADKDGQTINGVQVNRVIQKDQWFGPFNGTLLEEEAGKDVSSTWELCLRGDVWFYVDGRNKIHNNWLYHINPARNREEQNLEAFQHYGDIYYRALDTIQPGTELKVFYSDEYRQKIGCKMRLEDLKYDEDAGCFTCTWCQKTYHRSKSILRHIKFSHSEEDQALTKNTNLKERISKKARLMEALQQPAGEKRVLVAPKVVLEKEPTRDKEGHFVCVTCGKHFPTTGRLMAHELFHESACKKLECDMCNAVFDTSISLMRHKKVHDDQRFTCTMCFKKYSTRSHLSRHMNTAHGFERLRGKIVCMGCMKKFVLEDDMLKHLQSCRGLQQMLKERKEREVLQYDDGGVSNEEDYGSHRSEKFGFERNKSVGKRAQSLESCGKFRKDRRALCTMCHKCYSTPSHLSRHMQTAHGFDRAKGKIVCRGCSRMFNIEDNMLLHLKRCKGLQELTKQKKKLRKMLMESDEDDDDDDLVSNEEEDRQGRTIEGPAGSDSNKPRQDGKGMLVDMLGIRSTQDASKPFKCSHCKKRFFTKNRLLRHRRERHPKSSMFKCDKCDQTFPYRHRLMKHLPAHDKEKHFKCQLCPRSFASESALVNHQEEHTDARPHKCEPCMKGFRTRKLLLSHNRRIHSNREMRFACSFCDKKFAEKGNLIVHERRHRGIRPHVCLACGKAFTSKHCLISHIRIHTGEKPFKCDICGKCFNVNHHLQLHLFSHTQNSAETSTVQVHETAH